MDCLNFFKRCKIFPETIATILNTNLLDFVIPTGPWLCFATALAQTTRYFIIKSVLIHFLGIMCQSNTFLNCLLETVQCAGWDD